MLLFTVLILCYFKVKLPSFLLIMSCVLGVQVCTGQLEAAAHGLSVKALVDSKCRDCR